MKLFVSVNGIRKEFTTISAQHIESEIIPSAEHEAGHIVAAHHYGARILGIAIGVIPEERQWFLQAVYRWKNKSQTPVEILCLVKAAGAAADVLYSRKTSEQEIRRDLDDIKTLSGIRSLEPYQTKVKEILAGYPKQFTRITTRLRQNIETVEEWYLGILPSKDFGVFLISETELEQCLALK